MRRLLYRIFMLALLAVVAYNSWQVSAIKKEIVALDAEIAALHANRAKSSVTEGDFDGASVDLEKSLRFIKKASRHAGSRSADALKNLRETLSETRTEVEKLWQKLDKEPHNAKGG